MERVEAVVVGAGVIGLAVARALALKGFAPIILEKASHFGSETSSRNSEVIHAGIYYPDGSLKAALCVEGRERLYAYCRERNVPPRHCGKIIFAHSSDQSGALEQIQQAAASAGVEDLRPLDATAVRALEPALQAAEALLSPSTGIVDSHSLMQAFLADAENLGAVLVCNTEVSRITRGDGGWRVHIAGEDGPTVETPILVNCAGLGANALAARTEGLEAVHAPALHYARGVYFTYAGRTPFSRLIYPVPEPGGLGTHLTLDLSGGARFGPDVEWIDGVDYTVDPGRHAKFAAAAQRIWPQLDPAKLHPGYAGVRPKLSAQGEPAADFLISGPQDHGLDGLLNLFGIESPGLTSSMAIADRAVAKLV
jgi:L-2-hydroxyglutarate oxidase LhgO